VKGGGYKLGGKGCRPSYPVNLSPQLTSAHDPFVLERLRSKSD